MTNRSLTDSYKLCFIIAHIYFRPYESYLSYYISNINKLYPDSLILVIDNGSKYKEDVFKEITEITDKNVVIIDNDTDSKFEIGAYTRGLKYILDNNLKDKYDYYIFTQDTFVLKNKYDFNILIDNDVKACTINTYFQDDPNNIICRNVLTKLGLYNNLDKITFCYCSSFIIHKDRIVQLYSYLLKINNRTRLECSAGERYLARILYELNNHKNFDIDGDIRDILIDMAKRHNRYNPNNMYYDCWVVDIYKPAFTHFVKRVQQKNEFTQNIY